MSRKEAPRAGLVHAALAGRITNQQGATALRLSVRQFHRLKKRFARDGPRGLLHRGRGRPSPRRLDDDLRQRITALITTAYPGLNDVHLTEKLQEEHHLTISRASVRRLRRAAEQPTRRRRRPRLHRSRRPREAAAGSLVQIDGSPFDWLEARGPTMTLLGAIDFRGVGDVRRGRRWVTSSSARYQVNRGVSCQAPLGCSLPTRDL